MAVAKGIRPMQLGTQAQLFLPDHPLFSFSLPSRRQLIKRPILHTVDMRFHAHSTLLHWKSVQQLQHFLSPFECEVIFFESAEDIGLSLLALVQEKCEADMAADFHELCPFDFQSDLLRHRFKVFRLQE